MKKVVLLGDSMMQIGYGARVEDLLGEEYRVWRPEENCRFAAYTLRMLFDKREQIANADVIHWNNGAWDICELFGDGPFTPYEVYEQTMVRIAGILKQNAKRVIFATTMLPRPENPHNHADVIKSYNDRICRVLAPRNVEINDLCALTEGDLTRYIRGDDLIHLTDAGIEVCAEQVVRLIREENR